MGWFDAYLNKVGQYINMPGTTSTSSNLGVALEFSRCSKKKDDIEVCVKPVLFVFFFQNFNIFSGFRLNKPEFSAFPDEEEFLLKEGYGFIVLKIDENVVMDCKIITAVKDL